MSTDMIECKTQEAGQKSSCLEGKVAITEDYSGKSRGISPAAGGGQDGGNAGERASIGLESAPAPFGTVVPAARPNPHDSCYEAA